MNPNQTAQKNIQTEITSRQKGGASDVQALLDTSKRLLDSTPGKSAYDNFDPKTLSSSAMPTVNNQQKNAMSSGGSDISGTGQTKTYLMQGQKADGTFETPTSKGAEKAIEDMKDRTDGYIAMIDSAFDSRLAAQNKRYETAMADLKETTRLQQSSWTATAAKLNPYSDATTSTSIRGYQNRIDDKASKKALEITNAAEAAQAELEAGRTGAYLSIQQNLDQSIQNYKKEMRAEQQWYSTFLQNQKAQDFTMTNASFDNFRSALSTDLPSPTEIDNILASGQDIKKTALYPILQQAMAAGMDPGAALDWVKQSAQAQQDKTGMEWAKFNLQLDREERIASKQTTAQLQSAAISRVASLQPPASSASQEDWSNYYQAVASSSAGGKTDFRISDKFSNLATVMRSIEPLKAAIEGLTDTDPLKNILASKAPWAEKTKELEAWSSANAAPLARLFGEKGTLAEGDVQRIKSVLGGVGTPSAVREKLFNEFTDIISSKFTTELASLARQGYDVSGYAVDIPKVNQFRSDMKIDTKKEAPASFDNWYTNWVAGKTK